jgi:hypothetical protein
MAQPTQEQKCWGWKIKHKAQTVAKAEPLVAYSLYTELRKINQMVQYLLGWGTDTQTRLQHGVAHHLLSSEGRARDWPETFHILSVQSADPVITRSGSNGHHMQQYTWLECKPKLATACCDGTFQTYKQEILRTEGVAWSVERIPMDRSRYYFFQVAPQLYSRGWVSHVPNPLLLRKSGSTGNRTRDLWICSQELWRLDHRGSLSNPKGEKTKTKKKTLKNKNKYKNKEIKLHETRGSHGSDHEYYCLLGCDTA